MECEQKLRNFENELREEVMKLCVAKAKTFALHVTESGILTSKAKEVLLKHLDEAVKETDRAKREVENIKEEKEKTWWDLHKVQMDLDMSRSEAGNLLDVLREMRVEAAEKEREWNKERTELQSKIDSMEKLMAELNAKKVCIIIFISPKS